MLTFDKGRLPFLQIQVDFWLHITVKQETLATGNFSK